MGTTAKKVMTEAMKLPLPLRAFVAEKLIESLDLDDTLKLSAKWRREIQKRCAEVDRGSVKLRDAREVFARALASLA